MLNRGRPSWGSALRAGEWTAQLVAVAGVLVALAAIPDTGYRTVILIAAGVLILLALIIAVLPRRSPQPGFHIATPQHDQGFSGGEGVVVGGTVPDLNSDTLWVFEEGLIDERRVWFFGGEALVNGNSWTFDYRPKSEPAETVRRWLTIVRADRNCERQLRCIRPDGAGRLVVYDPIPGGCEVLGQVTVVLAGQARGTNA